MHMAIVWNAVREWCVSYRQRISCSGRHVVNKNVYWRRQTNLFAVRADAKLALPDRLHMPLPGSMLNYFLAKKNRGRNKGAQVGRI